MILWYVAAMAAWLGLLALPAPGHEFYPQECCSGQDCAPLDAARVRVTPQGYLIDGVHKVPFGQERLSPDEQYHGCFPGAYTSKTLGCFWAPKGSV